MVANDAAYFQQPVMVEFALTLLDQEVDELNIEQMVFAQL